MLNTKSERSVYHSSTCGNIPLSFTGRYHLQRLRYAITTAIKYQDYHANADELSRTRGELAKYMSELELRADRERSLLIASEVELKTELERRRRLNWSFMELKGYRAMMGLVVPPGPDMPVLRNCDKTPQFYVKRWWK